VDGSVLVGSRCCCCSCTCRRSCCVAVANSVCLSYYTLAISVLAREGATIAIGKLLELARRRLAAGPSPFVRSSLGAFAMVFVFVCVFVLRARSKNTLVASRVYTPPLGLLCARLCQSVSCRFRRLSASMFRSCCSCCCRSAPFHSLVLRMMCVLLLACCRLCDPSFRQACAVAAVSLSSASCALPADSSR
jgi:hypothetical protein